MRPDYEAWTKNADDYQCADPKLLKLVWKKDPKFAATIPQVALLLHQQLFPKATDIGRGLILVAGRTAAGKTQYPERAVVLLPEASPASACDGRCQSSQWRVAPGGLMCSPLVTRSKRPCFKGTSRRPHRHPGRSWNAAAYQKNKPERVVDFTSRSLGDDVESVKDALKDALRETTSAVVVSELREPDDFKAALEFAATGHLIFATTHSGSLVDTMEKLIGAANVKTPSGRSGLVHRLQAIIHLESLSIDHPKLTLPAMWRRNSAGVRNFVSEGLLAHSAPIAQTVSDASTLGMQPGRQTTQRSRAMAPQVFGHCRSESAGTRPGRKVRTGLPLFPSDKPPCPFASGSPASTN